MIASPCIFYDVTISSDTCLFSTGFLVIVKFTRLLQHVRVFFTGCLNVVYREIDKIRIRDVVKVIFSRLPLGIGALDFIRIRIDFQYEPPPVIVDVTIIAN